MVLWLAQNLGKASRASLPNLLVFSKLRCDHLCQELLCCNLGPVKRLSACCLLALTESGCQEGVGVVHVSIWKHSDVMLGSPLFSEEIKCGS